MSREGTERTARARLWIIVRVVLGLAGIGVVIWLIREVGTDEIAAVMLPALPFVPLAALFELGRIAMDTLSSHYTLGRQGARVPLRALFAAHVVAYAVMGVAPAGRSSAEAVKATLLARYLGGGSSAALGTANQANTLLSSGTFTLINAAAAYALTGFSLLTWLLVVHFVTMNLSGLALRAVARFSRLGAWIGKRFPRIASDADAFLETSRETSLVPAKPVIAMMGGRALQTGHFAVLAMAVGLSPSVLNALALHGVYLVVAALGVLIPGQIGASEGGFALAAEALDATVPQATSIALLAHIIQLALTALGFVVLVLWPAEKAERKEPTSDASARTR